MGKASLFALLILSFIPAIARAQATEKIGVDQILRVANQHLQKGWSCAQSENIDCARREFDLAIDTILESGVDVRSDERLRVAYRDLIEKINRVETSPTPSSASGIWRTQDFEGRPAPEKKAVVAFDNRSDGPLTIEEFQRRFEELRKNFREKYGRDITLTGADHEEHRRLYGRGSAFDIRVRDLTREQVGYIIAMGNGLGLRIKDFSTWDKVAAHNARTFMLGRPLDTLATGVHLHIDRMSPPNRRSFTSTTAAKSALRGSARPKAN
ncbi:MAG TPA: hypothetical protein VNN73_19240 [Blastocatellia bacterium]|nr:hypothetical protein [Blastocatellia bacterium]